MVKTADEQFVYPGGTVRFTVKITNAGWAVGNDLTLQDTLPAGFTFVDTKTREHFWQLGAIGTFGNTMTVQYDVHVADDVAAGIYFNHATTSVSNGHLPGNLSVASASIEVRGGNALGTAHEGGLTGGPLGGGQDQGNPTEGTGPTVGGQGSGLDGGVGNQGGNGTSGPAGGTTTDNQLPPGRVLGAATGSGGPTLLGDVTGNAPTTTAGFMAGLSQSGRPFLFSIIILICLFLLVVLLLYLFIKSRIYAD
ncbi:MAG: DUF11 domain-containing protein [Patescibacteria group bacterium]|nr:DUF11 domain-containing protein [Patescibacteria group bacterium]